MYLAPRLTFMGNTTPEQSEPFQQTPLSDSVNKEANFKQCVHFPFCYQPHFCIFSISLPKPSRRFSPELRSVWVKIAALREGPNRFTFSQVHIGGSGGWIVGVYLARSSIRRVLGFRLVDASGHTQTHTHTHMHTAVAVTHTGWLFSKREEIGKNTAWEMLEVCSRWLTHSKVPVRENLKPDGQISAFYYFPFLAVVCYWR